MRYTAEQIARVCHEANRALQQIHAAAGNTSTRQGLQDWCRLANYRRVPTLRPRAHSARSG